MILPRLRWHRATVTLGDGTNTVDARKLARMFAPPRWLRDLGFVAWFIVGAVRDPGPDGASFVIHFATTWVLVWLFVNGPMRVPFIRWRFRGGRLV